MGKTIYCPFMFMDYKEKKGRRCIHCERGEITFGDERELKDYIGRLYGILPTDRIFHLTKSFLHHEMTRGAEKAGVKRIRIHDLRHSHVSLLISMGFSAVSIGNRVGHESVDITYLCPPISFKADRNGRQAQY